MHSYHPSPIRSSSAPRRRHPRGWTFVELLAVILLAAVVLIIGAISIYRGKAAADELSCQDNMSAIHSALQIYWSKNARTYPANQAEFEQMLANPSYFPQEPHCPLDADQSLHYTYTRDPSNTGPEGLTITCPVSGSGHGSV